MNLRTGLFLSFFASATLLDAQQFQWVQRASLPAPGRWGAFTFIIDGYGYVAGGHSGSTFLRDVWRYDPVSDSWLQRADMPQGRRHGASWAINGKGYVTCGQVTNTTYSNMLWEYDPTIDVWVVKASLPGQARYGPHGFALNGKGYVGGGNYGSANGPYLNDMWRYDPVSNSWSTLNSFPGLARYGATSFVVGGKGYIHGGRDASLDFSNELWEFDDASLSWTAKPTMPGPGRSWSMVMAFPFEAVIGCGKDLPDGNLSDAYRYVPSLNAWNPIADYPGASGWSGASFAISGRTFGGMGRTILPSNGYFNDWWELIRVSEVGIGESLPGQSRAISVFPVPCAQGQSVNVVSGDLPHGQLTELIVIDIAGREVMRSAFRNGSMAPTQGLAKGRYEIMLIERGVPHSRGVMLIQ